MKIIFDLILERTSFFRHTLLIRSPLSAFARIENHYFVNDGFMRDGQILEKQEIDKIRHIPTTIVQGRYDVVCPATTAFALKKAWPEIQFHIVPDAGHSSREPGTSKLLVQATDGYANL
jgi:proline iminopeptidase